MLFGTIVEYHLEDGADEEAVIAPTANHVLPLRQLLKLYSELVSHFDLLGSFLLGLLCHLIVLQFFVRKVRRVLSDPLKRLLEQIFCVGFGRLKHVHRLEVDIGLVVEEELLHGAPTDSIPTLLDKFEHLGQLGDRAHVGVRELQRLLSLFLLNGRGIIHFPCGCSLIYPPRVRCATHVRHVIS